MSFFLTLIAAFFLGDVLWWWRAQRRLKGKVLRIATTVFALAQLGGLASVMGARWMGMGFDQVMPRPVLSLIFIWHLLFIAPWLLWTGVIALVRGVTVLAKKLAHLRDAQPQESEGLTRREFLTSASVLAPAVVASGAALASEEQLERFRVRSIEIPLPTLPPALDGLTIAHVSDVHVGRFTHDAILGRIADATNDLNADLILFTGDLINFSMRDLPAGIALLKSLRSKHGLFLCEGNHDLFEDAPGFRGKVRNSGLGLLVDQTATVTVRGEKLQILGLPWEHGDQGHAGAMRKLLTQLESGAFPIALAHHPHAFDFAESVPLMFAGHTHGGQLMLNGKTGFGPWLFRYWSGLYQKADRALLVSNGVGNWFPLRINAPAEIARVTLRRIAKTA